MVSGLRREMRHQIPAARRESPIPRTEIFDHLNQLARSPGRMKCLFLGMHYYTWHYPRLLKMEFHSLDMDPEQAIYGPPGRHVIGSVTDMSGY